MAFLFVRMNSGDVRVLSSAMGAVIEEGNLQEDTMERPTSADLMRMTKDQLIGVMNTFTISVRSNSRRNVQPRSLTKPALVDAIMRGWDDIFAPSVAIVAQAQHSSSSADTSSGYGATPFSGASHQLGKDDETNEHDDTSSDESNISETSIKSDYFAMFGDDFQVFTAEYLRDPSCFDDPINENTKPVRLNISEFKGKHLFAIVLENPDVSIMTFKQMVVGKISALARASGAPNNKVLTVEDFNLTYDGMVLDDLAYISNILDEQTSELDLTIVLKLRGGGGAGVRKSINKTKPTTAGDATAFSRAFDVAKNVSESSTCDLEKMFSEMDATALNHLRKFIAHNKTNLDKKISKVATFTPTYTQLQGIIEKLESARDKICTITMESINEQCMSEDESLKAVLVSKIDVAIGKKQGGASNNMEP